MQQIILITFPIPIILATLVAIGIGFLWYSPLAFRDKWMKLVGLSKKDITKAKQKMTQTYLGMFATTFVMAFVLDYLLDRLAIHTPSLGMQRAFIIWLGFIATVGYIEVLFAKKPLKLFLINSGYQLISMLGMGFVLGLTS